jgi:glycosyltransferase involved in cell wall biosynthesis
METVIAEMPAKAEFVRAAPKVAALPVIAYLSSQYARASDTFIRGEVAQLRAAGFTVHTFSVRKPPATETISPEVEAERARTQDLVNAGAFKLAIDTAVVAITRPAQFLKAAKVSLRLGNPGIKGRLWPVAYLMEAARLARLLRAKGVKHLHNHIGRNSASVALLASILSDVPYSLTIHGPTDFDLASTLALHEKVAGSRFTAGISDFGRSQLMRWSRPADWYRICVVRCGMDAAFLDAEPTPVPDSVKVICVGRLVPEKGHLLLVDAVAKLVQDNVRIELVLIGDGPMRGPITAAVDRLGLKDSFRLTGWQRPDQIRQHLRESRGMVMASFAEGLPVVLMESLAMARPVVSTAIAGIPELVREGENGWLVPAGSADAMADGLRRLLQTPSAQLTGMGIAGRERVRREHDAAESARQIADLILSPPTPNGSH